MNVYRTGMSTSTTALFAVLVVVILALGAYIALNPGTTKTVSVISTVTNTVTSNTSVTQTQTATTFTLAQAVALSAGGSSFVNPVMQIWTSAFHNSTQLVTINYQPVGSGAGITGVLAGTFDFAGSDAPVSAKQLANYSGKTLLQIPESLGGVAIFYNIPGITKALNLTGAIVASIYKQQTTFWDDPSIVALNPGVSLPHTAIVPVHRSDGSGTTYALTTYLSQIDSSWRSAVGVGTTVNFPTSELAGKGSSGVAGTVSNNPGAVGYADSYYAIKNKLLAANIKNSAGSFIAPTLASFSSAAADFSAQLAQNATSPITNAPGAKSYPISTFTYLLAWKAQTDQNKAYAIANFFWFIVNYGQTYGPPLNYATLPPNVAAASEALIAQINYQGQTFVG